MFFIMLAVYFHVLVTRPGRFFRNTILSGLSLGLAFLAKGPPAVLALAVIIAFQCAAHAFPDAFKGLHAPTQAALIHVIALVLVSTAVVTLVDLWHRAVAGTSFFAHYISHQLRFTIVEGRGRRKQLDVLPEHLPSGLALVAVRGFSVLLVVWKRDHGRYPPSCLAAR